MQLNTVSSGSPVGITYQIQNLTQQPIAVADRLCDVSYNDDSRTITVSVGSEVPKGGEMPHLTVIGPAIPVHYTPPPKTGLTDASQGGHAAGTF